MVEADGAGDGRRTFDFDGAGDVWLDHLVEALSPPDLGSIGPYEVLEEVARGGQGIVYRARQCGTHREIALKRLVEGRHATASARRRFEREIEVVATLDHPGVVTLYGVDHVDDVPVVAMQWVDGVPTDAWARAVPEGPTRRERILRLFLRLCDAVEHAHRRGILHLDLKPSNVLVDADGNPHVLDFGLSLIVERDAERTRSGAFLGTIAYASPEQLEGARRRLDVRSDVYSLGVLLHEMLTGARPFAFEDGVAPALAAQQRGDLELRHRGLGRELEAILVQALAARREARYPTVAALAEDVRRRLDGRPVLAHPAGFGYELAKFARRHRAASSLGVLSLLLLFAVAVQSWRHATALRAERNAQVEARRAAEQAGERATAEAATADGILEFLLSDVFELALPQNLGADLTLGELLDVASARSEERFAERPAVEARVRRTLGTVYRRLGRYADAERELVRAASLTPAGPGAALERALVAKELGHVCAQSGREPEAVVRFEEALASGGESPALRADLHHGIGLSRLGRGEVEAAGAAFARSLALVEEHRLDDARRVLATSGLGLARARVGAFDEARDHYEEALAYARRTYGPDDERVGDVLGMLSDLDEAEGKRDDAIRRSRESLRIMEGVYGDAHPVVAAALGDLGTLLAQPDKLEEGAALIERAIAINVAARGPDSVFTAFHRCRLGKNLVLRGRFQEAVEELEGALATIESARGPADSWVRAGRESLAMAFVSLGRHEDAERELRSLLEAHEALDLPRWSRTRLDLLLAQVVHLCGRSDEAGDLVDGAMAALAESERMPRAVLVKQIDWWAAWYRTREGERVAARLEGLKRRLELPE